VVKRAALLVLLGACANDSYVVQPYIDFPTNENASPYPIDQLSISVAHEGSTIDLVSATFNQGASIGLSDIPFGDDLVMHMTGRYKGTDVAYGRTCKFELRSDGRIPVPHLWLSKTVKFGGLTQQPIARQGGFAITYSDGSGLLLGGSPPESPTDGIAQVERFDPSTGAYNTLHEVSKRIGAAYALLGDISDTRVVVIGGIDPTITTADPITGVGATFIEVIDADRATDAQYDTFPDSHMPRIGMSATTLTDGRVIAIGGRVPPVGAVSDQVIQVTIESGTPIAAPLRAQLAFPRYLHTATRLGDQVGSPVLVAGGLDASGAPVAKAELFKPLAEDFVKTFQPAMVVPRRNHQAVRLPDGSVLIIGGLDAGGNPVRTLELFSLDTGFVSVGQLPDPAGVVDFTATTLPDGRVLITGGRLFEDGLPVNTAYIARLDPFDGTVDVVPTDRLLTPRAGHQATLLCDGTVLVSGGTPGQTVYERYNPPPADRR
jgi:hypothetical protein